MRIRVFLLLLLMFLRVLVLIICRSRVLRLSVGLLIRLSVVMLCVRLLGPCVVLEVLLVRIRILFRFRRLRCCGVSVWSLLSRSVSLRVSLMNLLVRV